LHRFATQHAKEQILSRYGVQPTKRDWRDAFLAVTDGRTLLAAIDRGREIHYLQVGGVSVRAVYSPRTASFITVLPLFNVRRKRPKLRRRHVNGVDDDG
jgi:hypothetical protein